LLVPGED